MLADTDPAARLDALMQDFRAPLAAAPDSATQQAQDARLAANLKLMERSGAGGTRRWCCATPAAFGCARA